MGKQGFLRGMGLGMAAGAAIGIALAPKKKRTLKRAAGKVLRSAGEAAENLSSAIEM